MSSAVANGDISVKRKKTSQKSSQSVEQALGEGADVIGFNDEKKEKAVTVNVRLSGKSLKVWNRLADLESERKGKFSPSQTIKEAIALRYLYETERKNGREVYLLINNQYISANDLMGF
ncbi:hypothetical protein BTA51_25995 [Hahella sp. CCB-MM4]|uniref:hypothetical protein n=1 Tax=Hahella sp. (strain CCB-MM4) TaxID=1926491 RepID=UPI000B9BD28B|nr:hypothetical protein [Hahella sp. CCB-MM4]OZG70423.1 hypothetical protein BTA51_25995 [Hahella sp. CCB-MM4]